MTSSSRPSGSSTRHVRTSSSARRFGFFDQQALSASRPGPPDGYVGRLNALAREYLGDAHTHDPDSWGVEATVDARLEPHVSSFALRRERMYLRYDSMVDYAREREEKIPAQQYLRSVLTEEQWWSWAADNERIAHEFDRAEGDGVCIEAEYLLVVAKR